MLTFFSCIDADTTKAVYGHPCSPFHSFAWTMSIQVLFKIKNFHISDIIFHFKNVYVVLCICCTVFISGDLILLSLHFELTISLGMSLLWQHLLNLRCHHKQPSKWLLINATAQTLHYNITNLKLAKWHNTIFLLMKKKNPYLWVALLFYLVFIIFYFMLFYNST